MALIVKMILSSLALTLSIPAAAKTHCLVHSSFNSTLQLISGISNDLQNLLKYFNDTAIVVVSRIPFLLFGAGWASVTPTDLVLYTKSLKVALSPISALNLVASSLKKNYKKTCCFRIIWTMFYQIVQRHHCTIVKLTLLSISKDLPFWSINVTIIL